MSEEKGSIKPAGDSSRTSEKFPSLYLLGSIIAITVALFFIVRMAAPSELMDKDQERPAAYLMDVLVNNNWIIQRDDTADITSKPSLYTWITAVTSIVLGGPSEWSLYIPTGLAVFGTALLILLAGDRYYNRRVGMTGAAMFLLSMVAWKQVQLARTDPLFSFLVFLSVIVLYEVIRGRVSWIVFWVIATLVTLTKGPLGVIFGLGGLLAILWEHRRDDKVPQSPARWGEQFLGIMIWLGVCGGWFFLAWLQVGQPLIDKMIGQELIGHAVAGERGKRPGEGLFYPTGYYLSRFAPWALLGALAIINIIRRPDPRPELRFIDRFLVAHFLLSLLILSLSPNQRPDHLFPIIPASILLGARELDRWWKAPMDRRGLGLYSAALFLFLIIQVAYITFYKTGEEKIARMREVDRMAESVRDWVGTDFPLVHVDAPFALQFRLGTMHQQVPMEWLVEALQSDYAVYGVIRRPTELFSLLPDDFSPRFHFQLTALDEPFLWIVSNNETLDWQDRMVHFKNGLKMEANGLAYRNSPDTAPNYRRMRSGSSLRLTNMVDSRRKLTLVIDTESGREHHPVILLAGQSVEYYF